MGPHKTYQEQVLLVVRQTFEKQAQWKSKIKQDNTAFKELLGGTQIIDKHLYSGQYCFANWALIKTDNITIFLLNM